MVDRATNAAESSASRSMSSSLLVRLRSSDAEAWRRFVHLYYPLVRQWCERARLQSEDAADVAQEVFRALSGNLGGFERDEGRNSFRGWLWGVTHRQLLAHWRRQKEQLVGAGGTAAQRRLDEIPEPLDEPVSSADLESERTGLLQRALELLRHDVEEATFQAFWKAAVEGLPARQIAAELGISVNAVYLAKGRLLRRLREEFGEVLEG
jgi:RNA polymerase sigma-70 factor (ECF subfamily)